MRQDVTSLEQMLALVFSFSNQQKYFDLGWLHARAFMFHLLDEVATTILFVFPVVPEFRDVVERFELMFACPCYV